jgi:hypothetical protein
LELQGTAQKKKPQECLDDLNPEAYEPFYELTLRILNSSTRHVKREFTGAVVLRLERGMRG